MEAAGDVQREQLETLAVAVVDATDAAGVGLIVTTSQTGEPRTLYANAAAAEISGYSQDELLELPSIALAPPDEARHLRELWQGRGGDGAARPNLETVLLGKGGARIPVELSASAAELDGQPLCVTFIVDVTRRRRAQVALRQSEERFRHLVESVPEAVWIADRRGVVYANPAAIKLFGYENIDEIKGADPRSVVHPDEVEHAMHREGAMLMRGERLPPREYRVFRRDGREMVVEVSSIAMHYEGHRVVLSFGRDVTERKQIEEQLLQADRLAALGLLAGGMAHAINNPLTYVLLNLEHLARQFPSLAQDKSHLSEALVRLKEAHHGAERVAGVIRQMRTFSRADDQTPARVDVRRVLDAAVAMVGNEIRHRGKLVTEYRDVPPVYARAAPLEQVFLNLLVQAAQSLPEAGHGEVRIVVTSEDAGRILVEVSHNGVGSGADSLELEPVLPHDAAEDRTLGPSFSYSILSEFGGDLHVERRGETTVFCVSLPVAAHTESATGPPSSDPAPTSPRAPRARVLVVDDDPGVGNALRLMLEDDNDVTCFTNAREALQQLLRDSSYDIVFCDLMMPELTGMDLFQALRMNRPGAEQKIVFMTGGAFTQKAKQFLAQVQRPHIEKPFNMRTLGRLVREAVRAKS